MAAAPQKALCKSGPGWAGFVLKFFILKKLKYIDI